MTTEQMDWLDDERAGRHNQPQDPTESGRSHELKGPAFELGEQLGENLASELIERMVQIGEEFRNKMSPAQRAMRNDMEEANSLKATLDSTFGTWNRNPTGRPMQVEENSLSPQLVEGVALDIINTSPSLTLGFKEWAAVQAMIEEGIRRGAALGQ